MTMLKAILVAHYMKVRSEAKCIFFSGDAARRIFLFILVFRAIGLISTSSYFNPVPGLSLDSGFSGIMIWHDLRTYHTPKILPTGMICPSLGFFMGTYLASSSTTGINLYRRRSRVLAFPRRPSRYQHPNLRRCGPNPLHPLLLPRQHHLPPPHIPFSQNTPPALTSPFLPQPMTPFICLLFQATIFTKRGIQHYITLTQSLASLGVETWFKPEFASWYTAQPFTGGGAEKG